MTTDSQPIQIQAGDYLIRSNSSQGSKSDRYADRPWDLLFVEDVESDRSGEPVYRVYSVASATFDDAGNPKVPVVEGALMVTRGRRSTLNAYTVKKACYRRRISTSDLLARSLAPVEPEKPANEIQPAEPPTLADLIRECNAVLERNTRAILAIEATCNLLVQALERASVTKGQLPLRLVPGEGAGAVSGTRSISG